MSEVESEMVKQRMRDGELRCCKCVNIHILLDISGSMIIRNIQMPKSLCIFGSSSVHRVVENPGCYELRKPKSMIC